MTDSDKTDFKPIKWELPPPPIIEFTPQEEIEFARAGHPVLTPYPFSGYEITPWMIDSKGHAYKVNPVDGSIYRRPK
jgi:hypothetical protein